MKLTVITIFFKVTIFAYVCTIPIFAFLTCPKEFLYQIGINTTCESEDHQVIPCDGSHPLHIKRAFINCTEEYFNHLNQQEISCDTKTGLWSPEPLRCFHHCDKFGEPEKIELLKNKTEHPWYVEVIKTPLSDHLDEIIPGLIMSGRTVITWEKYFNKTTDWNLANYVVRMYDSDNIYEDFNIERIEYVSSDPIYNTSRSENYQPFCILVLTDDNYIKITEKHRPPCLDHELFSNNKWFVEVIKAIPENNVRPNYPNQCIVPKVDDKNIEVICYQNINSIPLEKCPNQVPVLQTKCKLGYEKVHKTPTNENTIAMCVANRWSIKDSDCKLMCGNTDEVSDNNNDYRKTEIIKAPWHVAIYLNKTSIISPYDQSCSGVIIDENIILSAAHCFYDKEEKKLKDSSAFLIIAGKSYSNSFKERGISEQYAKIKNIFIPTTYGKENWNNDVAIIILNSSLTFNSYVKPICIDLNSNSDLKSETPGHMFGWRVTIEDEDIINNKLQKFDITATTGKKCNSVDSQEMEVMPGNFCSLKPNSPTICKSDSGGGFFTKETIESKERYILKGIISSDINNMQFCSNSSSILFTDLEFVKEFLKKTITENRDTTVNGKDVWQLLWYPIYAHKVWATPNWVRKQFNFNYLS